MRLRMLIAVLAAALSALTTVAVVSAPADAAPLRTWKRLAQCESSGRWHINTGNGYYGGLQISRSTWAGYGGKKFAPMPSRATKQEQIKVAERIKRGQGGHGGRDEHAKAHECPPHAFGVSCRVRAEVCPAIADGFTPRAAVAARERWVPRSCPRCSWDLRPDRTRRDREVVPAVRDTSP